MVAEQIGRRGAALTHCHTLPACVVIFHHRRGAAPPLEVATYIVRHRTVQRGFHAVAVPASEQGPS